MDRTRSAATFDFVRSHTGPIIPELLCSLQEYAATSNGERTMAAIRKVLVTGLLIVIVVPSLVGCEHLRQHLHKRQLYLHKLR